MSNKKRWKLKEPANKELLAELANQLHIDTGLVAILIQRGYDDFEKSRNFFRPSLSALHDPFLMKDMDKALERIEKALENKERIMIYGDYDVDGTTAVTLCYQFFSQFTTQISYYIPDRNKEGYGISSQGIDYAGEIGVDLIIALDCGIRSVDKVAYAQLKGIDFIICDHHLPGEILPGAVAVLDPQRPDCNYPFKELSGCGIGFKLVQAFCLKQQLSENNYLQYLDLCAVSIAADIVPMVDENRVLAYYGLKKLNESPSIGLKSLMLSAGKESNYTITDVVFLLAPRINAAGRLKHAKEAVEMLLSPNKELADRLSEIVNKQNTERKKLDKSITEQALLSIIQDEKLISAKTTVVYQREWNKGVIGIVASRLTETYYRPTIVMTESNGNYTGSARSVQGFDLHEALQQCSDLLIQFGGHKFAAGLTLAPENLTAFQRKFEEVVCQTIDPQLLVQELKIDTTLYLSQINEKFCRILKQFAPFGPENMAPLFLSENVTFVGELRKIGENHLKLVVKQENSTNFEAIGFGLGEYFEKLKANQPFDICYTIEENTWKGQTVIQLNLKGIRLKS